MKKILLIVVAIIVVLLVFMPKYVGMQFASGLQNTVDTINAKTAYKVSIEEVNSGWSSTEAVLNLGLDMSALNDVSADVPALSVTVNVKASHGPILTSGNNLIGLLHVLIVSQQSALPDAFVLAMQNSPIFKVDAVTGLFGGTDFTSDILGFTYTDNDSDFMLSFDGMQSQGSLANNGYQFSGTANAFSVNSQGVEMISVSNIDMNGASDMGLMQMIEQGLYNSESSLNIGKFVYTNAFDGSQSQAINTKVVAITTLDDATDMGDVMIKTSLAEFASSDMQLSDIIVTIEVNNLQAKFMRAYQEFATKNMEYVAEPAAMENALNTFLKEHLLEQLQQNPEYNISEISGVVNGASFNGEILTKLVNVTELPLSMEDTGFWMQHTNINTQMSMQKAAAEFFAKQFMLAQVAGNPQFSSMSEEEQEQILESQSIATLDALVQQGMLVREGEDYKVSFTLKDATAELNGNVIPL